MSERLAVFFVKRWVRRSPHLSLRSGDSVTVTIRLDVI